MSLPEQHDASRVRDLLEVDLMEYWMLFKLAPLLHWTVVLEIPVRIVAQGQ